MKQNSWHVTLRQMVVAGLLAASAAVAPQAMAAEPHMGGTLRLLATAGQGTLDPQINYTAQYWELYQHMYDGLLAYKKVNGPESFKIVPDLAEAIPQAQDGGKTYVFKLRKGIKFSDGSEVTVKDAVASFQRIFKISGPTAGSFYNVIVGADACLKTPATCTLEGCVVGDEAAGTITFHLVDPDPEFFDKLAVPHASILPASAPAKDAGNDAIPGTGPYIVASYDAKKQLKLVRNPHFKSWSNDAAPPAFPDGIDYDFGLKDEDEVTAVENGQADWTFDPIPADRLTEVATKFPKQLHINPLTAIFYMAMNTQIAPFDNLKARQAVNYAIDRKALVKIYGGSSAATPTCQILPPNFPGYEPYCPYTKNPGKTWSAPDMAKAKALMKDSGVIGQKVTVITDDTAVGKEIGTYFQSVLNEIGFDATVKIVSLDNEYTYIQNSKNKVQIAYTQWYQDYPAASDFLNVLFSCSGYHEGSDASPNISAFCDKDVDADIKTALATQVTDPKAAAKLWAAIDRKVTDAAAAAVFFNPKQIDFVSKRLQNFEFSGQFKWIIGRAWVQ